MTSPSRSKAQRILTTSLALAASALSFAGCGMEEQLEQDEQGLVTTDKAIETYFNGPKRYVRTTCGETCKWVPGPRGTSVKQCASDCSDDAVKKILLLADKNAGDPYPATASGSYQGCGVSAIGNIMNYVKWDHQTTERVESWAGVSNRGLPPGFRWITDNKGMTPDRLQGNIAKGLNDSRHRYNVVKFDHANIRSIIKYLRNGFPVVVLVNGGNHYQVITGYEAPNRYYATDYVRGGNGNGVWRTAEEMNFNKLDKLPSALLGYEGYQPGTFIAIDGYQIVQGQTPGSGNNTGPSGGACGDNPNPPQCEDGRVLNDHCQCDCNPNDEARCNSGMYTEWVGYPACQCKVDY